MLFRAAARNRDSLRAAASEGCDLIGIRQRDRIGWRVDARNACGRRIRIMANMLLPLEERNLTPEEVDQLDRRRRRGQLYMVICYQCVIVGTLVTIWSGQDLQYSPGWAHPMFYWNVVLGVLAIYFFVAGLRLRRGNHEFISY